jgi:hypothetical protein
VEDDLAIQLDFVRAANPDRRLFQAVASFLAERTARGEGFDRDSLAAAVVGRRGHDGRIDTCLAWLAAIGVIEGDVASGRARMLRPLDPSEIPEELGAEKLRRDLTRLQQVVEWVRSRECRRAPLARHFGQPAPGAPCGACDRCTDVEEWLDRELPRAVPEATPASAPDGAIPSRGDFVRIDGRWLGRVVRVSGRGRDALIEVESSADLTVRSYPLRRHRIERLEGR